jgi:hypothetical protein
VRARLFVARKLRRTRAPRPPRSRCAGRLAFNILLLRLAAVASSLALAITRQSSGLPSAAAHLHVRRRMRTYGFHQAPLAVRSDRITIFMLLGG